MQVDITVDTEALVVDAYPMMRETTSGVQADVFDIAWGFYRAMLKAHPEMVGAYTERMKEMIKAVSDIERAAKVYHTPWFTEEELEIDRDMQRYNSTRGTK